MNTLHIAAPERAAFEAHVLAWTGRDMAYHTSGGTTGMEFAWSCWQIAAVTAEREASKIRRPPLRPGAEIEYMDERATVVEDNGGPSILEECDGIRQEWTWNFNGTECTVVSLGEPKNVESMALTIVAALTDDQRLELFASYCRGCGRVFVGQNDRCHCQNDE